MVNVTTNLTSVNMPTTAFAVSCSLIEFDNVLILCPQSLHAVKTEKAHTKQYRCEYSCPKEFYTLDAGSMILYEKYQDFKHLNSSVHLSKVNCFPCPIGAYCDISIKALPNYYGFKASNANDITMVRCPDSYCCSSNETCAIYNSCNIGRTGTLCGSCKNNMTESIFSAKCIPQEDCYTKSVFILYLVLVLIYGIAVLVSQVVKKNILCMGIFFRKIKKKYFNCMKTYDHGKLQRIPSRQGEELGRRNYKCKNKNKIEKGYGVEINQHDIPNRKDITLQRIIPGKVHMGDQVSKHATEHTRAKADYHYKGYGFIQWKGNKQQRESSADTELSQVPNCQMKTK